MCKVKLLDCTLRDGGYLNDWRFGEDDIKYTIEHLVKAKMDIVEIGFLRDEEYISGRAVFRDIMKASEYLDLYNNKNRPLFSLMVEQFNPYPTKKLPYRDKTNIDAIRIIIWKRLIPEAVEYAKKFRDKGYQVCIQPERVNQYTIDEFKSMIETVSLIDPMGIYIVDSNGFLCKNDLLTYLKAAHDVMNPSISLGYHGHNNLLETVGTAESLVELGLDRKIIIDGSILGMGRSSGNLPIELFAKYMNDNWNGEYGILDLVEIYDRCIEKHYRNKPWGYSMQTFVTSALKANPNYAEILKSDYGLMSGEIYRTVEVMDNQDKVITNRNKLKDYIKDVGVGMAKSCIGEIAQKQNSLQNNKQKLLDTFLGGGGEIE